MQNCLRSEATQFRVIRNKWNYHVNYLFALCKPLAIRKYCENMGVRSELYIRESEIIWELFMLRHRFIRLLRLLLNKAHSGE